MIIAQIIGYTIVALFVLFGLVGLHGVGTDRYASRGSTFEFAASLVSIGFLTALQDNSE